MTFKSGWVCKPMALSGLGFTYGCVARAYEYPGDKGLKADGKQMRDWYERAAQAGDSEAAYLVALRSKDELKKRELFEQAAMAGHAKAAYQFSMLLPLDKSESIKWLSVAVDENVADAIYELGLRHRDGRGVKKDLNQTRQLWLQAAEAGSILAMVSLSSSYQFDSILFDKNTEKYQYWKQKTLNEKERRMANKIHYSISMQEDPYNAHVSTRVKYMLEHMDEQEKNITQTIENDHDYLKKKAKLYLLHQDGDVVLRNKAIVTYTRLARAGDVDSQFELATLLLNSKQPNSGELEEGHKWLITSANAGHERAIRKLTDAYKKGLYGFPKDLIKSLHYSEKLRGELTKHSNSPRNRLSRMFAYFESQNAEADLKKHERLKTIKMLRVPAQQGDANAQYHLAHLLMVERKRTESYSWIAKAAKNGNPDAQYLQARRIAHKKPRDKFAKLSFAYMKEAAEKNHPGAMLYLADNYSVGYKRVYLKRNMYQAYLLYNKALSMTNEDVIFVNKFGNPKMTSPITRDYVVAKLNKIPESIKRLKLHGLTAAQKNSYVEQWYLKEIENLDRKKNPQEYLDIINDQRDALLSSSR